LTKTKGDKKMKKYFINVDLSYNYVVLSDSEESAIEWAKKEILKEEPDIEIEEVDDDFDEDDFE
jgi:hypothetical protein